MIRVRRPVVALAAALALGTALAGCTGSTPAHTKSPTPKPTPLYSSDAKALTAARSLYERYVAVSNEVGHAGWADTSRLEEVATGDALKSDTSAATKNHDAGLILSGDISGKVVRVQDVTSVAVTVYACVDLTATKIVDDAGNDRTSPNRTTLIPFEVRMTRPGRALLISRSDIWSGSSFC